MPARRRFSRPRVVGGLLVAIALAALGIFGLAGTSSRKRVASALAAAYLSGPHVSLASLLADAHGRRVLVTFWASWCTPCAEEATALEQFASSAAGRGRIVGVDFSETQAAGLSFIRRHRWTFATLSDALGTVGNAYRVPSLPTTFVIDASGRIVGELRGPQTLASLARAYRGPG
jgi:thiol-disulfide isomerase/thioredoxin